MKEEYKSCEFLLLRKAYIDSLKNNFWDAWGIVASPRVIYELRAECMERMMVVHSNIGILEKIFGLVVISYALLDNETCYVVDEQLGRTILEQMEREDE